ncbi:MAG: DUF1801 domain-containing protein [Bacteroidota bacterium]
MAENKTKETSSKIADFVSSVDEKKQADTLALIKIFEEETKLPGRMWGTAIIGFGSYHYKYASGHEGDAPKAAFSPRKNAISLYLNPEFEQKKELLKQFGKHKTGKGCVYINKLSDVDEDILRKLISDSIKAYPQ